MAELKFKQEVYDIAGPLMEVYYTLGTGFLEPVYQEALSIELERRGIPFQREEYLTLYYKNVELKKKYCADFICFGKIIVELKVVPRLTNIEMGQIINYMKITRHNVGVLANFGSHPTLEWKRYVI